MAHIMFPNHHAAAAATSPVTSARPSHAARRQHQDEQRARKAAFLMTNPCEIILVRHGETAWNKEGRLQGQQEPGPPLDGLGTEQAAMAARVLQQRYPHVDAVFSSDLLRAVQTAEVVAAAYSLQVQTHKGLRERHMGVLQGLTYTDAPHEQPEAWAALQADNTSTRVPGGESLDELRERLTAAVLDIARTHAGRRVVLISHGGALHSLHRAARGYQAKGKVFNCSISVLLAEADAAVAAGGDGGDRAGSDGKTNTSSSRSGTAQQGQQQEQSATAHHSQQHDHHEPQPQHHNVAEPGALSVEVVAEADDQVSVVWCDLADMCHHCSVNEDSNSSHNNNEDGGSGGSNMHHHQQQSCSEAVGGVEPTPADAAASAASAGPSSSRNHPTHAAGGGDAAAAATRKSSGALMQRSGSKGGGGGGSMKRCGGGKVKGGRLALMLWNDSCALQEAHLQSDKAFGGSSRAG